ncbi:MAG: hypothetical protein ABIP39_02300 [Polyangiaceae bacterium]
MTSAMRIVLCGPEGEELFSGYSVSTLPPPAPAKALPSISDDEEGEDASESGIYLTESVRAAQESR